MHLTVVENLGLEQYTVSVLEQNSSCCLSRLRILAVGCLVNVPRSILI